MFMFSYKGALSKISFFNASCESSSCYHNTQNLDQVFGN